MGYVLTEASCHDRTAAETVMTQLPHPYTLGDKGYVSQALQKKLYDESRSLFGRLPEKINVWCNQKNGNNDNSNFC